MRLSGAGMPTSARRSSARLRAAVADRSVCVRMVSTSWSPTRIERVQARQRVLEDHADALAAHAPQRLAARGCRCARPRAGPRRPRCGPADRSARSRPSRSRTCRPRIRRRPPAPRPAAMSKETRSSARSMPRRVTNSTVRSRTSSSASLIVPPRRPSSRPRGRGRAGTRVNCR